MLAFLRRFKNYVVSAICLALPFFFLRANLKEPANMNALDRLLMTVSAPVQGVVTAVARSAGAVVEDYVYLVTVKEEVDRLRYENARLREENHRFQRAEIENRRLRRMLEFREAFEGDLRSAQVIGKDRGLFWRVTRIRVDRGHGDQVRKGMPVVTHAGLVGQILRTHGGYADVLLATDPRSAVAVVIERTGAHGIVRGTNDTSRYALRMEHLESEHEVRVGDLVHTSGEDRKFPAGILVGKISSLTRASRALHQEAEVRPAVDYSPIEEVFVILKSPGEEPGGGPDSVSLGGPGRGRGAR